jgi:hypothetical protein
MSLQWYRADDYCQRSSCGRFTIARVHAGPVMWYEAFRVEGWAEGKQCGTARHLLGATRLPITASNADRIEAVAQMKALCDAEALTIPTPTDKVAASPAAH